MNKKTTAPMPLKKPVFSSSFAITEQQRHGAGALIFVGSSALAKTAIERGCRNVLLVPAGEDVMSFDWSILRGCSALVVLVAAVNTKIVAACLRSFGVVDIALIDYTVAPPLLRLAPTEKTLSAALELRGAR